MQDAPEDADDWGRPVWEDEADEAREDLLPRTLAHGGTGRDTEQTLLAPLATAVEAVARLDARAGCASDRVAEGLRRRLALREAAGWLAHQGAWVHPTDLALREAGLTGSYTAAAITGRLRSALPATSDAGPLDHVADDLAVSCALQLGRLWLRLAERRTWAPLASADALRQTLGPLGQYGHPDEALSGFLGRFAGKPGTGSRAVPPLLRAGQAAQAWTSEYAGAGEGRADRLSTSGLFLAACVGRRGTTAAAIALPVWSATPSRLQALAGKVGATWIADFLDCVTDAAQRAGQELTRLQAAEQRISELTQTARSHLPGAADLALRLPVLTARTLAERLQVTPQAALGLIRQLAAAGLLREPTGRQAWRAFVVA
jgi:HTH DNA binding domain